MAMRCLVLLAALGCADAARSSTAVSANPIRRVVNMLQAMQKKVNEEAKIDKELFEKFMCFCTNGAKTLEETIAAAETKLPQVTAALEEATAQMEQLEKDLAEHKADRAEAKEALAKATALREKEAAVFAKDSSDHKTNLAALGKAIDALEKGAAGSFLQTDTAGAIRRLTVSIEMNSVDRDLLASFLSGGSEYAPQSGQITGILKMMKDTMEKNLAQITADEEEAKANYAELSAAKEKEIESNSKAIESKLERHGQVGIEIENLKEDIDDTGKSLEEDKKFLADLDKNCATKKEEYDAVVETRAQELLAIAEAVKILNEDDALELFKKTLPSPSLLQIRTSAKELREQVIRTLQSKQAIADPRLDFLMLAVRGKKVSFDKVLTMIDEMVTLLGEEQKADDRKKAYCEEEIDKNEDSKKVLDLAISDLTKAVEDATNNIATLTEELAALTQGIKDLDKQVAEATENRKKEHAEYTTTMNNDRAAKEIIKSAANRLHKFYNPTLYKPKAEEELTEEERISKNMGVSYAQSALDFMQMMSRRSSKAAPPPPPKAFEAYTKKGEESTGVVEMMNMLVTDLEKEMTEIETDEKNAQEEYEQFITDSGAKRAADSKSIEEKETAKADLEAQSQKMDLEKKGKLKEAYATAMTLRDLHLECDWLVSNFEARKEARTGEAEALKNAKAVLSGADYSLLQLAHSHRESE